MPNSFIDDYYALTLDLESPDSYIYWGSYATLSAIMRDQYYWQDYNGKRRIYPNIYVILYAKSSATRKGAPLSFAQSLIREIGNTKFFGGRFSIQAAIKRMSELGVNPNTKERITGGSCTMYSEEIADLFAEAEAATKILTDLYDYHEVWENDILKNDEIQTVRNVCITLLAGSNDVLFKEVFSSSSLAGGLLRRIFLVAENRKRHHTSPFKSIKVDTSLRKKLIDHLMWLSKHKGEIIFSEAAIHEFNAWYESLEDAQMNDESGVVSSLHTSAQKLAMIFAAAEYDFEFIVSKTHIERAIDEVTKMARNYKLIAPMAGEINAKNGYVKLGPEILKILMKSPKYQMSREALLRRITGICNDIKYFEQTMQWLEDTSGFIKTSRLGNGEIGFQLTDKLLEMYEAGPKEKKVE